MTTGMSMLCLRAVQSAWRPAMGWPALAAVPALLWVLGTVRPAAASPVEVVFVELTPGGASWRVAVTLRHADAGWTHYANLWVVETADGRELGRRVLLHPHDDEQPFTRAAHIAIPAGLSRLRVRAGDNVAGLDNDALIIDLTVTQGARHRLRRYAGPTTHSARAGSPSARGR